MKVRPDINNLYFFNEENRGKVFNGRPELYQHVKDLNDFIDYQESQKKDMIESIEQLLLIIHPNLRIFTAKEVGKDRSHVWNNVVSQAQKLIKQGIS